MFFWRKFDKKSLCTVYAVTRKNPPGICGVGMMQTPGVGCCERTLFQKYPFQFRVGRLDFCRDGLCGMRLGQDRTGVLMPDARNNPLIPGQGMQHLLKPGFEILLWDTGFKYGRGDNASHQNVIVPCFPCLGERQGADTSISFHGYQWTATSALSFIDR